MSGSRYSIKFYSMQYFSIFLGRSVRILFMIEMSSSENEFRDRICARIPPG
jgi:hypothetical protein